MAMGMFKDVKVATITQHAERALQEGRFIFLARINVPINDLAGFSGPVSGVAEQIEAVERAGWTLREMSYIQGKGHIQGFYLFRRR